MQPIANLDLAENQNRLAYNSMARSNHPLAVVATREELSNPFPAIDTSGWLGGSIRGWKVLCLAAGGGRHAPLYAAAGADVTVVDISEEMLELDRRILSETHLQARLILGSMAKMPMLRRGEFDLVIQPVSSCYVANLAPMFQEVARVLRSQGLYISQHKQPLNLQASLDCPLGKYTLETAPNQPALPSPINTRSPLREPNSIEFAHSLESILGGMCRSGLHIEDVREPDHSNADGLPGTIGHRSCIIPPYLRVKARKADSSTNTQSSLVIP